MIGGVGGWRFGGDRLKAELQNGDCLKVGL